MAAPWLPANRQHVQAVGDGYGAILLYDRHAVRDVLIHQGGGRVRAGEGVGAAYGAMGVTGEEPTQLTLGQVQLLVGVRLSVLRTLLTPVAGSST